MTCTHDAPRPHDVCRHLLDGGTAHLVRLTGRGSEHALVCEDCADVRELVPVCDACRETARAAGTIRLVGTYAIEERPSALHLAQRALVPPTPALVEVAPVVGADRAVFVGLDAAGGLHRWDAEGGTTQLLARVPPIVSDDGYTLQLSRDATLAVVAATRGTHLHVVDLVGGELLRTLARDEYCHEVCNVAAAFVEHGGRTLLVHATAWNRLDVMDPRTGEVLTGRELPARAEDDPRDDRDLDYFHCGLSISPGQRHIVDSGWVWHPIGVLVAWSLERWLSDNVWESENGTSRRDLGWRDDWDVPLCWIDDDHVAVSGLGTGLDEMQEGVRIFDVRTGQEVRWFGGPAGALVFDRQLVSVTAAELSVWDVVTGERLLHAPIAGPVRYHPTAKCFVTLPMGQPPTLTRICGGSAEAPWATERVLAVAASVDRDGAMPELAILGDALELAGCDDAALLAHCRAPGEHAGRCWALDQLTRAPSP